jgi:hypothetical protein
MAELKNARSDDRWYHLCWNKFAAILKAIFDWLIETGRFGHWLIASMSEGVEAGREGLVNVDKEPELSGSQDAFEDALIDPDFKEELEFPMPAPRLERRVFGAQNAPRVFRNQTREIHDDELRGPAERARGRRAVHRGRYYAVADGWVRGMYDTWAEALANIVNFPHWVCHGFGIRQEAEQFMEQYDRTRQQLGFPIE